jgi:uncharacterized protein with predicted RNA binding PUA domain
VRRVQAIADYQFGSLCGTGLFPDNCEFLLSSTGRIRQVFLDTKRLATVRAQDGRLTLGIGGARRLQACLPAPRSRVVVQDDVAKFIAQGKNVFAKHVVSADGDIRCGDEVLVVAAGDRLLACGTAVLSGAEMAAFKYGGAVKVRQGSAQP